MASLSKIELSDSLKINIEVGKYGKFLRFTRNKSWITLNDKTWRFLKNNISMMSEAFEMEEIGV